MTLKLRPGIKVRPIQGSSALDKFVGYVSEEPAANPKNVKVYFPDLDVVLSFGMDELEMWVENGRPVTDYLYEDAVNAVPALPPRIESPNPPTLWAFTDDGLTGDDEAPGPYDDIELHEGEDYVREINSYDNGFDAEVYVDDEDGGKLSKYVSFDIAHIFNGEVSDEDSVGVLMTPDAAYSLAHLLLEAAEKAEANS